jgi:hypothetical protein
MHARPDFGHAAAVDAILRAHRFAAHKSAGEEMSARGIRPLWGRGLAAAAGHHNLRGPRPQSGGC